MSTAVLGSVALVDWREMHYQALLVGIVTAMSECDESIVAFEFETLVDPACSVPHRSDVHVKFACGTHALIELKYLPLSCVRLPTNKTKRAHEIAKAKQDCDFAKIHKKLPMAYEFGPKRAKFNESYVLCKYKNWWPSCTNSPYNSAMGSSENLFEECLQTRTDKSAKRCLTLKESVENAKAQCTKYRDLLLGRTPNADALAYELGKSIACFVMLGVGRNSLIYDVDALQVLDA